MLESLSLVFGVHGEIPDVDGWQKLLEGAGLRDLSARTYKAEGLSSRRDDLADLLRTWPKVLHMLATRPAFRSFLKESLSVRKRLPEYFGYGLYVGRREC